MSYVAFTDPYRLKIIARGEIPENPDEIEQEGNAERSGWAVAITALVRLGFCLEHAIFTPFCRSI